MCISRSRSSALRESFSYSLSNQYSAFYDIVIVLFANFNASLLQAILQMAISTIHHDTTYIIYQVNNVA